MRIDKFMKISRLAKRRTEAHDALVAGRISHEDGRTIKPGYAVRLNETLVIRYARKTLVIRILHVPERVTPATRSMVMYEVVSETREAPSAEACFFSTYDA